MMILGLNQVILGVGKSVEEEVHDVDAGAAVEKIHVIMVVGKRFGEEIQMTQIQIMRNHVRKRRMPCVRLTVIILWNLVAVDVQKILSLIIHCLKFRVVLKTTEIRRRRQLKEREKVLGNIVIVKRNLNLMKVKRKWLRRKKRKLMKMKEVQTLLVQMIKDPK